MDFTLKTYSKILNVLINQSYEFQSFEEFIKRPKQKVVILRHDVDRLPENAMLTAKIEADLEIKGSYYFRIVKQSNKAEIIKQIVALGHEVGYHYEDLTLAKGDVEYAYRLYQKHLNYFKQYYPVKTICMHGSPMSKYDNRDIWKYYNYKEDGIIGEPYFDVDFTKVLYLTDTGRRWDGDHVSVRDKVNQNMYKKFRRTSDIINEAKLEKLPSFIMIIVHPQRWTNNLILWSKELILQNIKNMVKRILVAHG